MSRKLTNLMIILFILSCVLYLIPQGPSVTDSETRTLTRNGFYYPMFYEGFDIGPNQMLSIELEHVRGRATLIIDHSDALFGDFLGVSDNYTSSSWEYVNTGLGTKTIRVSATLEPDTMVRMTITTYSLASYPQIFAIGLLWFSGVMLLIAYLTLPTRTDRRLFLPFAIAGLSLFYIFLRIGLAENLWNFIFLLGVTFTMMPALAVLFLHKTRLGTHRTIEDDIHFPKGDADIPPYKTLAERLREHNKGKDQQ